MTDSAKEYPELQELAQLCLRVLCHRWYTATRRARERPRHVVHSERTRAHQAAKDHDEALTPHSHAGGRPRRWPCAAAVSWLERLYVSCGGVQNLDHASRRHELCCGRLLRVAGPLLATNVVHIAAEARGGVVRAGQLVSSASCCHADDVVSVAPSSHPALVQAAQKTRCTLRTAAPVHASPTHYVGSDPLFQHGSAEWYQQVFTNALAFRPVFAVIRLMRAPSVACSAARRCSTVCGVQQKHPVQPGPGRSPAGQARCISRHDLSVTTSISASLQAAAHPC